MANLTVRKCEKEDFESVCKLLRQLWPDQQLHPETLSAIFHKAINSPHQELIVATQENEVVGFCTLTIKNNLWVSGNLGHIDELIVDKKLRGQGVGRTLMDKITEAAKKHNCKRIELDTAFHRKEAHQFYQNQGYENRAYLFSKEL